MQQLITPGEKSEAQLTQLQQGVEWVNEQTQRFIYKNKDQITGIVSLPDKNVTIDRLKHLRVTKFHTFNPDTAYFGTAFGLTLNDGQHAKAHEGVNSEYFMPDVPLREIVITYSKYEDAIKQLTLVFQDSTIKQLGASSPEGRVDRYVLAKDEHIIGATIEHNSGG